jgi:glutamate-1-semialdehyde aminotransferase
MGHPAMPFLVFGSTENFKGTWYEELYRHGDPGTEQDKKYFQHFYNGMVRRGVFLHPRHHWFTCYSHTRNEVEETLNAAEASIGEVSK